MAATQTATSQAMQITSRATNATSSKTWKMQVHFKKCTELAHTTTKFDVTVNNEHGPAVTGNLRWSRMCTTHLEPLFETQKR